MPAIATSDGPRAGIGKAVSAKETLAIWQRGQVRCAGRGAGWLAKMAEADRRQERPRAVEREMAATEKRQELAREEMRVP
ncbi:MAG: hypothetical protein ACOY3P_04680 [Planctomycetota bacterium]